MRQFHMGLVATLLATVVAVADVPKLELGTPIMIGSGCNKDNSAVTLSDDKTTLSILFSEYNTEAGGIQTTSRRTCNLRVPVRVPSGLSVSLLSVDYRGYNFLPPGASSLFHVEYFFAGRRGPVGDYRFPNSNREDGTPDPNTGVLDHDFYIGNKLTGVAVNWSPCGQPVTLAVNTYITATTNAAGDQATASVDSADIHTETPIVYRLTWRACR